MIDKKEQKRLADRAKERKYIKTKVRQVMVKFNLTTDERELFEYLYSQKNMQGYVKKLLRADMEDEWDDADAEEFEQVMYQAADRLGVGII